MAGRRPGRRFFTRALRTLPRRRCWMCRKGGCNCHSSSRVSFPSASPVRVKAIEVALNDALTRGLSVKEATKLAQKEGTKAAKQATCQAKRITGPILASGWDFFKAVYYGGTVTEGSLRGVGTLIGAYAGGFHGEQRLGRLGYLVGTHVGNWIGGRVGLMIYDVINGFNYLLQFVNPKSGISYEKSSYENRCKL